MTEKSSAEVVIIGAGIVGASIAWHLAQDGCTDVVLLDREAKQGLGSTGKATGGVRAQFATDINIRLSLYSIRFFAEFREHVGGECGYLPYGYLFLARSVEEMRTLELNRERQNHAGLTNVTLLDPSSIRSLVPALSVDDLAGGSFCPTDGFLDPSATMSAFTRAATSRGVSLTLDAPVTAIEIASGRVRGVRTSRGTIATPTVVNAAGGWSAEVAKLAGVDLPVVPLRRQLVAIDADLDLSPETPMVLELGGGFHFRYGPWASNRTPLLMGWPDPLEKPGFGVAFEPSRAEVVIERARHRLPRLRGAVINTMYSRAGLYEISPDHHAILGPSPDLEGFFFANGFSGHGVMHSPATGRILADLILRGRTDAFDITTLRPERFANGTFLQETAIL